MPTPSQPIEQSVRRRLPTAIRDFCLSSALRLNAGKNVIR
jgi:hypothetical protein